MYFQWCGTITCLYVSIFWLMKVLLNILNLSLLKSQNQCLYNGLTLSRITMKKKRIMQLPSINTCWKQVTLSLRVPIMKRARYGTNLMLIMPPKKCSLGDIDSPCTVCFVTNKSRSSWSSLNWSNFSMHYSSHTHSDHLPFLGSFKLFLVSRTMFAAIIPLVLSLIHSQFLIFIKLSFYTSS